MFPHTNPSGQLINLYGRAVSFGGTVPKGLVHDHHPGNKAWFNGIALTKGHRPALRLRRSVRRERGARQRRPAGRTEASAGGVTTDQLRQLRRFLDVGPGGDSKQTMLVGASHTFDRLDGMI